VVPAGKGPTDEQLDRADERRAHPDEPRYGAAMRVVSVPCLKDNFAYLVIDGNRCAVVDPGEAGPVEAALAREKVELAAIWATHHHPDHVDGVAALVAAHPGIEVVAGKTDAPKIKHVTRSVDEGDVVTLGDVRAMIIHNPGHTLGAISFHTDDGCVFTGDTLFAAGCGRVFEGDPPMMHASLSKLAALPPATKVYFGHEYTVANLRFAAAVEPDNAAIKDRVAEAAAARERGDHTTPSTIAAERATNPFLRSAEPAVIAAARSRDASAGDAVSTFAAIRQWKNEFK
jgi:hydroxyacylglutathione hydrolase